MRKDHPCKLCRGTLEPRWLLYSLEDILEGVHPRCLNTYLMMGFGGDLDGALTNSIDHNRLDRAVTNSINHNRLDLVPVLLRYTPVFWSDFVYAVSTRERPDSLALVAFIVKHPPRYQMNWRNICLHALDNGNCAALRLVHHGAPGYPLQGEGRVFIGSPKMKQAFRMHWEKVDWAAERFFLADQSPHLPPEMLLPVLTVATRATEKATLSNLQFRRDRKRKFSAFH